MLAFDGGSTKTDVVLVARLRRRSRPGPGRPEQPPTGRASKGRSGAVRGVRRGHRATRNAAGAPSPLCPTGVYCLAGIDLPVDEEKLAPAIDALGWTDRVILRNDTFAVSRAGTTAPWGIGVVCGTGMNCAAVGPDGRTVRFPALAELSGDFAPGGAWLGPARARPRAAGRRRPGRRHHAARTSTGAPRNARRGGRADRHLHRRHPLRPALRAGPRPPRRGGRG